MKKYFIILLCGFLFFEGLFHLVPYVLNTNPWPLYYGLAHYFSAGFAFILTIIYAGVEAVVRTFRESSATTLAGSDNNWKRIFVISTVVTALFIFPLRLFTGQFGQGINLFYICVALVNFVIALAYDNKNNKARGQSIVSIILSLVLFILAAHDYFLRNLK